MIYDHIDPLGMYNRNLKQEWQSTTSATTANRKFKLQAKNAKLWELASLVSEYISYDRCEGCVIKTACNSHELDECWMTTKLRNQLCELRVEVDE